MNRKRPCIIYFTKSTPTDIPGRGANLLLRSHDLFPLYIWVYDSAVNDSLDLNLQPRENKVLWIQLDLFLDQYLSDKSVFDSDKLLSTSECPFLIKSKYSDFSGILSYHSPPILYGLRLISYMQAPDLSADRLLCCSISITMRSTLRFLQLCNSVQRFSVACACCAGSSSTIRSALLSFS